MSIKHKDKYKCSYCLKEYPDPVKADACRDNHDLVYVGLSRSDLNRLLQFIFTGEKELLTESLIKTLYKYQRIQNG